jgi:hypothetical protein
VQGVPSCSSCAASTFHHIRNPLSLIEQYVYFGSLILDKYQPLPMCAVNVGAIITVFRLGSHRGKYKLYTILSVSSRVLALIARVSIESKMYLNSQLRQKGGLAD